MSYYVSEISQIIGAKCSGQSNAPIQILLTDSRSLSNAAVSLFFALKTEQNDGHRYIHELYRQGVRTFVIQHEFDGMNELTDACLLSVDDTLAALQMLAAHHRQQFNIPVIGITGSNGKTIVKEWLYQLLNPYLNIVRSPRSYNSQTGVPLSIWQMNPQNELAIFEAGISQPNEMQRIGPVISPTVGIFTTLGEAHQENFISHEEKCLEKLQLFVNSETIIYNEDNQLVKYCLKEKGLLDKTFAWSRINPNADLFVKNVEKEIDKTKISVEVQKFEFLQTIMISFTDDASIEDAIHCLSLLIVLSKNNFKFSTFDFKFDKLETVAMRLDVSKGMNRNMLINDTYNSDINSLSIALDFMARRSTDGKLKRVLILSDILQSGMVPAAFYRKVAELVRHKQVEQFIGIGPCLMSHSNLFSMEKEFFPTTENFLDSGRWRALKDSIILIKGSRQSRFERITEQLEEKAHQTVLEVDLDAVIHNFKYFRSLLHSKTKIVCMVKAFGYGVGSYELAKTLQERGADYLAVAIADEGAELRREGVTMPIMVMNPEEHAFNTLFEYRLEPEIYNFSMLDAIIHETSRRGIMHYPIHVKLDTGMSRMGFGTEEISRLTECLDNEGVTVKSVFSHLAGSDSPLLDDFTHEQIHRFTKESAIIEQSLSYHFIKHILNSSGIERFPEAQFDMVRLGIGLYGISAVNNSVLRPVASLKTRILQIREVKTTETVGYNRNGILKRISRIACLPIGYADGLDRRLSNGRGSVVINGQKCSLIGNICMDICMADVTDCDAHEGDTAVIFGDVITVNDIAAQLQTIPYEILTSISPRIKRVYYKE
ncbi:MAG: bifunctional UDP-N-acetylmuramoyl-tripeptide:D-alanyl-D-alanine ligase/alanine racemase [Dysgonamonadaceae bacterium]|jgi:alanine racemase|nr:bifunctional UDP-N-acetylmuramoyl-tripeptide:D-alanyl-D-alanine ligase/alanine racemase [Dysgonamonadaceae bacterium]